MAHKPQIIENPRDMSAHSQEVRQRGLTIGFVPTMGALHQGHLSLLDYTREHCDHLVVSIFVNPLQFDRADDLDGYPRTWDADLAGCSAHGADLIYAPTPEVMYPAGYQTKVSVSEVTQGLCGAGRPGHFDGVATVVLKLFNLVQPHISAFGRKDFQQLRMVQRMVTDLDLPLKVVGRPTVREADGLAMSSRNQHLSAEERGQALCLHRALTKARELVAGGEMKAEALKAAAAVEIGRAPQARLEYLEVVDGHNLTSLETVDQDAVMALAVWLGNTRLIDNMTLAVLTGDAEI